MDDAFRWFCPLVLYSKLGKESMNYLANITCLSVYFKIYTIEKGDSVIQRELDLKRKQTTIIMKKGNVWLIINLIKNCY